MAVMNVSVTGATGLVGTRLTGTLVAAGHAVHMLGRKRPTSLAPAVEFSEWISTQVEPPPGSLATADAVIHLAGEPVAQRWTRDAKDRIRSSRVEGTRRLVNTLSTQTRRPQVLVSASATGIYGSRGEEILTESSAPGTDFIARLAVDWEQAAARAETLGIRVVLLRLGIVLGPGGALAKMLPAFRMGAGGRLGSGAQWMPWVHLEDVVGLILFALENASLRGPVNATAPNPVTNAQFTRALGAALHRPAILPVPRFAIQLLFGEMAGLVLASQRVIPMAAQNSGYQFQYSDLDAALANLL